MRSEPFFAMINQTGGVSKHLYDVRPQIICRVLKLELKVICMLITSTPYILYETKFPIHL
jgi:hypothetical protein